MLEVFAYVLTKDMAEYTAICEDILFRFMEIVEEGGTDFAFALQTVRVGQDTGLDKAKAEQVEAKVRQWREQKQLPFPDFTPAEISEFRDSLLYPPPESAVNRENR
jgi:MscS family membrane protein